jgi:fatty acid desaturase
MTQVELRNRIAELRKDKRNGPTLLHLGANVAIVAFGIWLLKTQPLWLVGPVVFVLNGFAQYRGVNGAHEAVHKNLLQPVWLNEFVGTVCAALAGVSMGNYRPGHLEHHKSPQTVQDDSDGYIYRPLMLCEPGWPRVRLLLFGLWTDIAMKVKRKLVGHERESAQAKAAGSPLLASLVQLIPIALVQGAMWALFWWQVNWWSYFVFWFAPVFFVTLLLDRTRTFIEHSYAYFFPGPPNPDLSKTPQSTIDVTTNGFERFFFAPFGFAYHQAHHAQLNVPYYNLPELTRLLREHDPDYYPPVRASYLTLLKRVLWAGKLDKLPDTPMNPSAAA